MSNSNLSENIFICDFKAFVWVFMVSKEHVLLFEYLSYRYSRNYFQRREFTYLVKSDSYSLPFLYFAQDSRDKEHYSLFSS